VTGYTKNEYKEQMKSRGTSKMRTSHTILYMEWHLLFTCARGHVPRD